MALLTKLINASSTGILNKDSDIQALADSILNQGVITTSGLGDLEVTAGQVASGRCFIRVNRTNTTPEENWLLLVINQEDTAVTLGSNKKIYIEIPQDNINDSSLNTNPLGTGVAEIVVDTAFPTGNYIPLAETDGSGNITDLRDFITIKGSLIDEIDLTQLTGGNWKILYTDGSGNIQELALGSSTQVLTSNGASSAPSFQSVSFDINTLTEDTTGDMDNDYIVKYDGSNKKILLNKYRATDGEVLAGTVTNKFFTPKQFKDGFSIFPADIKIAESTGEINSTATSYTKVKEILINKTGTYRITFTLKSNSTAEPMFGKIYKNGVAFGTEQTTASATYVTFTQDLSFTLGELCQLYIFQENGGTGTTVSTNSLAVNGISIPNSILPTVNI